MKFSLIISALLFCAACGPPQKGGRVIYQITDSQKNVWYADKVYFDTGYIRMTTFSGKTKYLYDTQMIIDQISTVTQTVAVE